MTPWLVLTVFLCLAAGVGIGWLAAHARSASETARLRATVEAQAAGEQRLEQAMRSLSNDALSKNNSTFGQLVAPLQDNLSKVERHVSEVEKERTQAYSGLREQIELMHRTNIQLRAETAQLVAALRAPQVRGRWGEQQLRRIVEAAGMVSHCDFTEQVTTNTPDGLIRPDMMVTLAGGKQVVVDAKVPFAAYLEAMEARDENVRTERLTAHAKHLRHHVDALSSKAYWEAFPTTPEFVVLFVPADTFLDAAVQHDATLLEHGFARNVVIATPSTLIALLRTVAYTWRQDALARNAAEVHKLGQDLYLRLAKLGDHWDKLGTSLSTTVNRYNTAVGSLEGRVLVTARRFGELQGITSELPPPEQVETAPRKLQAAELIDKAV